MTNRQGEPMVSKLLSLLPDLTTGAEHNTEFVHIQRALITDSDLITIINDTKPSVILTFYTSVKNRIQKLTSKFVTNIHSYQGQETDIALVVQMNPTPGEWGLCGDKKYIISALTRARKTVVLLTVGYHQIVDSLGKLVTKSGGGNADDNLIRVNNIEELKVLLVNLVKH